MVLSDMERGCVRGCVEECCGIFLFRVLTRKGGRRPIKINNINKHKWGRQCGEGKLIMEWEFINSVTNQLAKIVFQYYEIKMKYAEI
jgi:hypothetical protein